MILQGSGGSVLHQATHSVGSSPTCQPVLRLAPRSIKLDKPAGAGCRQHAPVGCRGEDPDFLLRHSTLGSLAALLQRGPNLKRAPPLTWSAPAAHGTRSAAASAPPCVPPSPAGGGKGRAHAGPERWPRVCTCAGECPALQPPFRPNKGSAGVDCSLTRPAAVRCQDSQLVMCSRSL